MSVSIEYSLLYMEGLPSRLSAQPGPRIRCRAANDRVANSARGIRCQRVFGRLYHFLSFFFPIILMCTSACPDGTRQVAPQEQGDFVYLHACFLQRALNVPLLPCVPRSCFREQKLRILSFRISAGIFSSRLALLILALALPRTFPTGTFVPIAAIANLSSSPSPNRSHPWPPPCLQSLLTIRTRSGRRTRWRREQPRPHRTPW